MELSEVLNSLSIEDIQKLRLLSSIFGGTTQLNAKDIFVEQGLREYEKHSEFNLAPKTLSLIKTSNRRLLEFIPGNRILNTIEKKDAENLIIKISKTAPLGVANYHRVYRAMFNVFKSWDYVFINPFEKIKLPKRQKEDPAVFTNEQINTTHNLLIEKGKSVIADMVLFAVDTGLRLAEEANLRWCDIDFKNKVITIGNKYFSTKSKKIRRIPFNNRIEEILIRNSNRQLTNGNILREFVFTQNNGKPYKLDTISKSFKKVLREAGFAEELHWHSLRATAASNWVNKKVPIYTVQKLLGHANVSTTQVYSKVSLDELRDAVNKL